MLNIWQRIAKLLGAQYVLASDKYSRGTVCRAHKNGKDFFVLEGRYFIRMTDDNTFVVGEDSFFLRDFVSWEWVK